MIGWFIALGILALLALLPVGVWLSYDHGDFTVKIPIWLFKLHIYPKKSKKKSEQKGKEDKKRDIPIELSVESVMELLNLLWRFVQKTGRRLRVREVDVQVVCGGGDAAMVALDYGKTCAVVSAIEPFFDSVFAVKRRKIQVDLDFERKSQSTKAILDIRLCLASLLYLLAYLAKHGFTFYKRRRKKAA